MSVEGKGVVPFETACPIRPDRNRVSTVEYWEGYALWYKLWLDHNDYHRPVMDMLTQIVQPGWQVLDIGGGSGCLSLFLQKFGCRAVIIEPAQAMRQLFSAEHERQGGAGIEVDVRRWEDIPLPQIHGFDLILACNSLHVMPNGARGALQKMFVAGPRYVFVAIEDPHVCSLNGWTWRGYELTLSKSAEVPSFHAYHSISQALAHGVFLKGGTLTPEEESLFVSCLEFEKEHYWLRGAARLHLYLWSKTAVSGS